MRPIFFAWTRSFWLTVTGLALLLFGAPPEVMHGIAVPLSVVLPWSSYEIGDVLARCAPAVLWVVALQQRSGRVRPYTTDPTAIK